MANSPTTFEEAFRLRLLDVIYAQWRHLGAPFTGPLFDDFPEVIDPEALIWASLEFLPTESRLAETVLLWLHAYRIYTIHQRLKSRFGAGEPRTNIWLAVLQRDPGTSRMPRLPEDPSEPSYGMNSPQEVIKFSESFRDWAHSRQPSDLRRIGKPDKGPTTTLLRARDLMGSDARHFLLLYLLCNPHGAPLKPLQEWTGYTSRTVIDTVTRWVDVGVVSMDHGVCRLIEPNAWEAILHFRFRRIALINWYRAFDASVRLLRALARGRRIGLSEDSSVVLSHRTDAYHAIASSGLNEYGSQGASLRYLLSAFPR